MKTNKKYGKLFTSVVCTKPKLFTVKTRNNLAEDAIIETLSETRQRERGTISQESR